jgi:uncharacterized protein (DUF362 family)
LRFQDKKALHKSDSKKRAALGLMFKKGHFSLNKVDLLTAKRPGLDHTTDPEHISAIFLHALLEYPIARASHS